jgi:hypothetical protein
MLKKNLRGAPTRKSEGLGSIHGSVADFEQSILHLQASFALYEKRMGL